MISVPSGVQVWLATDHTDMRKGFDGLALLVQETLHRNPQRQPLRVPRAARLADQGVVARRPGHVPLRQAARARPLRLAWNDYSRYFRPSAASSNVSFAPQAASRDLRFSAKALSVI